MPAEHEHPAPKRLGDDRERRRVKPRVDARGRPEDRPSRAIAKYTRGPAIVIALMLAAMLTMVNAAIQSARPKVKSRSATYR